MKALHARQPHAEISRAHGACGHAPRAGHHGLSLIELLVVLACIAILTSLALPDVSAWQQRSQRAQARTALLQAAQWLERSAAANGRYPSLSEVPARAWQIDGLRYQITARLDAQSYTLRAVPIDTQASDACGVLTLDHLGQRGVEQALATAASCWSR